MTEIAFFGTISSIAFSKRGNVVVGMDRDLQLSAPRELGPLLAALHERRLPVYFHAGELLDIKRVRIPRVVRVEMLEGRFVTFEQSNVRAEAANEEILNALRRAADTRESIAVTITDAFRIIDVRPFPAPPPDTAPPEAPLAPPIGPDEAVSPKRAQQLFDLCAHTSCDPQTVPPPCIPFLYPDDGCWGRAHEMARLLIRAGARPRKIWIYGTLRTPTVNNPCCVVPWRFHVAPTLYVRTGDSAVEEQVIDPSLFTTPVSIADWASVQNDPAATFVSTSHYIFSRFYDSEQLDLTYAKTNEVLDYFRLQLQARTVSIGPPPYVCPPAKPCA